jgi:hypothetical protein
MGRVHSIQGRYTVEGTESESAFRRRAGARGRFHIRSPLLLRPFTHGASGMGNSYS